MISFFYLAVRRGMAIASRIGLELHSLLHCPESMLLAGVFLSFLSGSSIHFPML